MMKKNHKQSGFTLIELMLATIIFSVVLLIILTSFLQIGKMFYKGISFAATQESARSLIEGLSEDVRFAQRAVMCGTPAAPAHCPVTSVPNTFYFCVGLHRYTYVLGDKLDASEVNNPLKGIQKTTIQGDCADPTVPGGAGTAPEQMLGTDMQVNKFEFSCSSEGRCPMNIRLVFYGADPEVFASDLTPPPASPFQASDAYCTGPLLSSQFCGTMQINTLVLVRD